MNNNGLLSIIYKILSYVNKKIASLIWDLLIRVSLPNLATYYHQKKH